MPISIIRLVYSGQHLTFHWNETALQMVFIRMVPSPLCSFLFLLLDDQSPFFFKPSSKTILILVYKHLRKFRANVLLFLSLVCVGQCCSWLLFVFLFFFYLYGEDSVRFILCNPKKNNTSTCCVLFPFVLCSHFHGHTCLQNAFLIVTLRFPL